MISTTAVSRRQMLQKSAAVSALWFLSNPLEALGAPKPAETEVPIPFLDAQPAGKMLKWEKMDSWITPTEDVFAVSHYGTPKPDAGKYSLELTGLLKSPRKLTIDDILARPRKTITATLECSGNGSNAGFMGAIGNVKWTGTPLAPLLREASPLKRAVEVVFFGADEKVEKIRDKDYLQQFARSLHISDAYRDDILLAYEMNGQPLTEAHGAPLRLIVPGWYGIAWVKWLRRIELLDRRYMSKYMAREYVTIRGEERGDGQTVWRETSVSLMNVKSIIARASRLSDGTIRLSGAAWTDGTPLKTVEVQIRSTDKATPTDTWQSARLDTKHFARNAWTFFQFDWKNPTSGDFYVVSRAVDQEGREQPAFEDSPIQMKKTYWEANQQWPRRIRVT